MIRRLGCSLFSKGVPPLQYARFRLPPGQWEGRNRVLEVVPRVGLRHDRQWGSGLGLGRARQEQALKTGVA